MQNVSRPISGYWLPGGHDAVAFAKSQRTRTVQRLIAVALVSCLIIGVVSACRDGGHVMPTADVAAVPQQQLPTVWSGISLPTDEVAVLSSAARFPDEIAGRARLALGADVCHGLVCVAYGEAPNAAGRMAAIFVVQKTLSATPEILAESGAQRVAEEIQRLIAAGLPVAAGRDGAIVWLYASGSSEVFLAGRLDSPWLWAARAPDSQQLEALLTTFYTVTMGRKPVCLATDSCALVS